MDLFRNPQGDVRNGWKVAGFVLVFVGLVALFNITAKFLLHIHHVGTLTNLVLSTAMGLVAGWICLAFEKKPLASMGYRFDGRWAAELGLGVLGGAAVLVLAALVSMGAGGFHWIRGAGSLASTGWGLILFILVGFNEETLFRGYYFQRAVDGLGDVGGLLVGGAIFALAHFNNPGMHGATLYWAAVNIGLAGILLGLCYLKTRSLALPIGVHIGWNFTQGNLLGFGVSGTSEARGLLQPVFHARPEWLTGGAFGLEASVPCALVCLAAIILLARWKGRGLSGDPSTVPAS